MSLVCGEGDGNQDGFARYGHACSATHCCMESCSLFRFLQSKARKSDQQCVSQTSTTTHFVGVALHAPLLFFLQRKEGENRVSFTSAATNRGSLLYGSLAPLDCFLRRKSGAGRESALRDDQQHDHALAKIRNRMALCRGRQLAKDGSHLLRKGDRTETAKAVVNQRAKCLVRGD